MSDEQEQQLATVIRDRVVGLERYKSSDIKLNPKNWRTHPDAQRKALRGVLNEIGIAGVCIVYESERYGGITLIDGELRTTEIDQELPCALLDVDDDEADKIIATFDALSAMASSDEARVKELLDGMRFEDDAANELIERMRVEHDLAVTAWQDDVTDIEAIAPYNAEDEQGVIRIKVPRSELEDVHKRLEAWLDGEKIQHDTRTF